MRTPSPHLRERSGVEHAAGLVVERQVQRDQVGVPVDVSQALGPFDSELAEALARDEWVVRDDVEPEPEGTPRDLAPDAAEAEDAERLARELDTREAATVPGPAGERRVRLRDVPCQREEQCDGVLGGRHDRRLGRVRDDDPAACGRVDVHVVDPDACAADHS